MKVGVYVTHGAPSRSRSRAAAPSPHRWWCQSSVGTPGETMTAVCSSGSTNLKDEPFLFSIYTSIFAAVQVSHFTSCSIFYSDHHYKRVYPTFTVRRTSDLSARFSSSSSCSLLRRHSSWLSATAVVFPPGGRGCCSGVHTLESVSFSSVAFATIRSSSSFLLSSCCSWWTWLDEKGLDKLII